MNPVGVGVDHRNTGVAKSTDRRSSRGSFHPDEQDVDVFVLLLGVYEEPRSEPCGEPKRNEVGMDTEVPPEVDVPF